MPFNVRVDVPIFLQREQEEMNLDQQSPVPSYIQKFREIESKKKKSMIIKFVTGSECVAELV